jgi:hypothetical protein
MKSSLGALLCAVSLFSFLGPVVSARAESQPYCMAYARDLANRKVVTRSSLDPLVVSPAGELAATTASITQPSDDEAKLERLWRRAYKAALQSCLEQYSTDAPKPVLATPLAAPKAVATPKPVAKVAKKVEKQAEAASGPKRGSDEWNKSCLAKHPSFNAETGTYRTWSGAQRECRL